jgi:hypothetical protein
MRHATKLALNGIYPKLYHYCLVSLYLLVDFLRDYRLGLLMFGATRINYFILALWPPQHFTSGPLLQATATAMHIHIAKACMHIFIRSGLHFRAQRSGDPFISSQDMVLRTELKLSQKSFPTFATHLFLAHLIHFMQCVSEFP